MADEASLPLWVQIVTAILGGVGGLAGIVTTLLTNRHNGQLQAVNHNHEKEIKLLEHRRQDDAQAEEERRERFEICQDVVRTFQAWLKLRFSSTSMLRVRSPQEYDLWIHLESLSVRFETEFAPDIAAAYRELVEETGKEDNDPDYDGDIDPNEWQESAMDTWNRRCTDFLNKSRAAYGPRQ